MDLDRAPERRRFSAVFVTIVIIATTVIVVLPLTNRPTPPPPTSPTSTTSVRMPSQTLVFQATGDGSIFSNDRERVFADQPDLRLDAEPSIESVISFSVDDLTGAIASATLRLYAVTAAAEVRASPVSIDWSESDLSYSDRPNRLTDDYSETRNTEAGAWLQVDVTQFVEAAGEYAFSISQTSPTLTNLSSREGSNPPQLIIAMAPEGTNPPAIEENNPRIGTNPVSWIPRISDPEDEIFTCFLTRYPQAGKVELADDCSLITYTAHPGSSGNDRFDYSVSDGIYVTRKVTMVAFDTAFGVPLTSGEQGYFGPTRGGFDIRAYDPDGRCPVTLRIASGPSDAVTIGQTECWQGYATARVTPVADPPVSPLSLTYVATDVDDLMSRPATLTISAIASATDISVHPVEDGSVSATMKDSSVIGSNLRMDTDPTSVAYLLFDIRDLSAAPSGATLRIYVDSSSFDGFSVYECDSGWTERDLQDGFVPECSADSFTETGAIWDGEWIEIPLPARLLTGDWVALACSIDGSRAVSIASSESQNPPALFITKNPAARAGG